MENNNHTDPIWELVKLKADLALKSNRKLIKENEVVELLGNEFPTINNDLEKISDTGNVYKAVQCFADFTKKLVNKGNFSEVKHCFVVAEKMMQNGNNTVKNAIENAYIYSISSILDLTSPVSQTVKKLMTDSLKKEYNRQVGSCGI